MPESSNETFIVWLSHFSGDLNENSYKTKLIVQIQKTNYNNNKNLCGHNITSIFETGAQHWGTFPYTYSIFTLIDLSIPGAFRCLPIVCYLNLASQIAWGIPK